MTKFTALQIATFLKGRLQGDENATVDRLSKIEEGSAGSLTFLANPKYTPYIYSTEATIVIVGKDFIPEKSVSATLVKVDDPYAAFAQLLEMYNQYSRTVSGISKMAFISENAEIGENVYVGEFSVISDGCRIGNGVKIYPQVFVGTGATIDDNTTIYAGVKIYPDSIIGKNCTIHSGAVIGADGFGFAPQQADEYKKVAQIGNVIIEDNVEIGANTTIDRATLGSTVIRKGVKLDNLIQVAHNVEIGENTVIAAQTGISGSTKIGKNCLIAGQVGIVGHLKIGDDVKIGAQSGVSTGIKDHLVYIGSPAFEGSKYRKSVVHFRNLHSIVERLEAIEKRLKSDNDIYT